MDWHLYILNNYSRIQVLDMLQMLQWISNKRYRQLSPVSMWENPSRNNARFHTWIWLGSTKCRDSTRHQYFVGQLRLHELSIDLHHSRGRLCWSVPWLPCRHFFCELPADKCKRIKNKRDRISLQNMYKLHQRFLDSWDWQLEDIIVWKASWCNNWGQDDPIWRGRTRWNS